MSGRLLVTGKREDRRDISRCSDVVRRLDVPFADTSPALILFSKLIKICVVYLNPSHI